MRLIDLFICFAKIGVMTFGGGYAMLPLLQREVVENKKWVTEDELLNYYAIGQCTPGIIAVNVATFIGTKYRGILGGIIATLGVVFPSFVIITFIASILSLVKENIYFVKAFNGIRIAVCALILSSVIKLILKAKKDIMWFFIVLVSFSLQLLLSVNSIYIVICSIIFGFLVYLYNREFKK